MDTEKVPTCSESFLDLGNNPYRIMQLMDADMTAIKIYFTEDGTIKVHQTH